MQELYKKEIEEIKNTGYMRNDITITDALVENFYNEILPERDSKLIDLVFSSNPTQEALDKLIQEWDIEARPMGKTMLLAYFMKMHPELEFNAYTGPRLDGLIKMQKFKNMAIIAHFVKIVRELNKNGITPVILKGGAMRHLRPEFPRIMGDIDILVPEKDFFKAAKIAEDLGYWYSKVDIHAIDLHEKGKENGILDIHRFIYMETGKERNFLKGLFERATEQNVFGVKALVPSYEDLMFITLTNLAKNLRNATSKAGLLFALYDCKFFLEKPDFNWKIIHEDAKLTGSQIQINFAIKFIDKISKDIIPEDIKNNFIFEKETTEYSNMVMFNRFYLEDLRNKCRALKIGEVLVNPNLWADYIKLKPKYFALKLLKKHPKLIEMLIKDLKTKEYDFGRKE